MALDRANRDVQPAGDLGVGLVLTQGVEHLGLPRRHRHLGDGLHHLIIAGIRGGSVVVPWWARMSDRRRGRSVGVTSTALSKEAPMFTYYVNRTLAQERIAGFEAEAEANRRVRRLRRLRHHIPVRCEP